jgi:parvulin-like peptidyl-prolyl isomerase
MAGALLLCLAGGAMGQTAGKGGGQPAAEVNGEVITLAELDAVLKKEGPMAVPLPEALRKQHQQIALSALIDERLIRQFLKQNGSAVDPKEVQARLSELVAGLKMQNKTLADFCRDLNQTEEQVKAGLVAWLQWNAYARQHMKDEDVEKFYLENKDMFDKILVRASEIMLRVPPQSGENEKAQAKAQLMDIRNKLLASQDPNGFAQMAKQFSQGPTRDEGGDLDWFPHVKGILPEGILRTAFTLPPGQLSDVIETEAGMHLIKVTDRKAGQPSDFAKIKEEVRLVYIDEMKQNLIGQLRKQSKITINLP